MLTTSAAQQAMFASHNIVFVPPRVQVNLPVLGWTDLSAQVSNVQVQASLVTDQPDGTRFEVGYPSLQLTFVYADTTGMFAPYNTASPIYRHPAAKCAVTCDWGTPTGVNGATEWLRKFTGQVDTYEVMTDGTVKFTCIDNRSLLRSSVSVPAVVTAPPFNAGLTSEFAIDHLLRIASNGTISSWPAQRPQCVLTVGMRSSTWPEVGTLDTGATQIVGFVPGAFGSALTGATTRVSYMLDSAVPATSTSLFVEMWVTNVAAATGPIMQLGFLSGGTFTPSLSLSIDTANGLMLSAVGSVNWHPTISTGAHYVAAQVTIDSGGNISATLRLDGATSSTLAGIFVTPAAMTRAVLAPQGSATIEAIQVTTEAAPTSNYGFTPQAVLDPSLNPLQVVPAVDVGSDVWQVIQQIADAELGVAAMDESTGKFYFRNRDTLRTSAPVATLTSSVSLKDLDIEVDAAALSNRVQIPYQGWTFAKTGTLAAQFTSAHKVAAHSTQTFTLTTDQMVAQIDSVFSVLPNTGAPTRDAAGNPIDGNSWYRASIDSAGTTEHPGVTVTATQITPNQVNVTVVNPAGVTAWFVVPSNYTDIDAGTPSLWLGGLPVTPGDQVTADTGATFKVNPTDPDVTYQAQVNPWMQDGDTANDLAFRIADDMSGIQPQLTNIDVVPRPDLQLGDRVILQDPDVTSISEHVVLWGWTLTAQAGSDSMQIDGRAVAAPGQWILDDNTRSILDSTTYI